MATTTRTIVEVAGGLEFCDLGTAPCRSLGCCWGHVPGADARFRPADAERILPVGTLVAWSTGTHRITGFSLVPVSAAYGNAAGDRVDVGLARISPTTGATLGRTWARLSAAELAALEVVTR